MTSTSEPSWSAASRSESRRRAPEKGGHPCYCSTELARIGTSPSRFSRRYPTLPSLPYRPSTLAKLAARLIAQLGHREVDVAGVSWGGGVAQQFAHQHPDMCRKLILAATSPGAIMVPGRLSVIWKLATTRRYIERAYMRSIAAEIYGDRVRRDPDLIATHAQALWDMADMGYWFQLLAMAGWTTLPWL